MHITEHAYLRAAQHMGWTRTKLERQLAAAVKRGKRHNYGYLHRGVVFGMNASLDVLKTVYFV